MAHRRQVLIDTTIVIDHLRKSDKRGSLFYRIFDDTILYFSAVTAFELYAGATDERKRKDIETILSYGGVLPFDSNVAEKAGELYRLLKQNNKMIEMRDLFIAATALAHEFPVLTLNRKHFDRVPGLTLLESPER